MTTAVWWIRRDLRLADNPALTAALASAAEVVPLFVLDPRMLPTTGEDRGQELPGLSDGHVGCAGGVTKVAPPGAPAND